MNSVYVLLFHSGSTENDKVNRNFYVILKEVPVLDYLITHFQIASFDASVLYIWKYTSIDRSGKTLHCHFFDKDKN